MKIGELAQAAQCDTQTIRYYEREGLIPPPERTDSNYRSYGPRHQSRLQFIRRCRSLDMTLEEIRALLSFIDAPDRDCGEVNRVLDDHIGHVAARIEELSQLHGQLRKLRRKCHDVSAARECGILNTLGSMDMGVTPGDRHVRGSHARRAKPG